jgi:tripartite-type tricarboxylate transporter receptor subunit TctC
MKTLLKSLFCAFCVAIAPLQLSAQTFPTKPLRLVVTLPPGGATDTTARLIAAKLGEVLGQPVVIENKPGAGGQIGAEMVAKSAPDGYTLLFGGINTHGISPVLYKKLSYDPVRDFAPVSLATSTPNVLVVHPSVPAKTMAEFIAYAKANPGKVSYSTPGHGTSLHITMEEIAQREGIQWLQVPY